jgi:LysR family transcriptional repressor of citA
MCDLTLSEAGVYIRSLFPKNHVFHLEVDNTSKLLPYIEEGLGYAFLPYKFVEPQIKAGVFEEVPLKDFASPQITTYLIYRHNYDVSSFVKK